jgi:hypothetical protein
MGAVPGCDRDGVALLRNFGNTIKLAKDAEIRDRVFGIFLTDLMKSLSTKGKQLYLGAYPRAIYLKLKSYLPRHAECSFNVRPRSWPFNEGRRTAINQENRRDIPSRRVEPASNATPPNLVDASVGYA